MRRTKNIAPFALLIAACGAPDPSSSIAPPPSATPPIANDGDAAADASAPSPAAIAEQLFDALLPDLRSACGGCHSQGSLAPLWLAAPEYASVKAYEGIVTADPSTSKLLTKGRHSGPALPSALRDRVEAWLTAEAKALAPAAVITTGPFAIVRGANSRELGGIGGAPPGARLDFVASWDSGDVRVKLAKLTIVAPAGAGVRVVHPRFGVARELDVVPDAVDGFSTVDVTVAAGQSQILGDGLIFLESWQDGDGLAITFDELQSSP